MWNFPESHKNKVNPISTLQNHTFEIVFLSLTLILKKWSIKNCIHILLTAIKKISALGKIGLFGRPSVRP